MLADAVARHAAPSRARSARRASARWSCSKIFDLDAPRRRARDEPAVRRPAPARDRARARDRAEAAAARRAGGRHEPAGDARADAARSAGMRDEFELTILLVEHNMKARDGHLRARSRCSTTATTIADRHARGDPAATRRSSRPTSARRRRTRATAHARARDLDVHYGAIHALQAASRSRSTGRDRHAHRRERRRQDDDAARDLRPARADGRRDHVRRRRRSPERCRRTRSSRAASRMSPEGRGIFANLTVARTSRWAPTCARTTAQVAAGHRARRSRCSRASRSASSSTPARSPAASSRCSRSRAR